MTTAKGEAISPEDRASGRLPVAPSMRPALESLNVPVERSPVDRRVLFIGGLGIGLGLVASLIARGLTVLIGIITNLAFYGHWSTEFVGPAGNHLGGFVVLVPIVGGLVVGLMARYGSAAIRGHGIPEAMEKVLFNESRIPARMTFLKPLSAAISIGSGGPFGAEGPIIATGGALGSFIGQVLRVSAEERKTLLAAGAAAGMSATFSAPVSAVLLAIELLLFEYRSRSLVPVALASAAACGAHMALVGSEPAFAMPAVQAPGGVALAVYVGMGAIVGFASMLVTRAVYAVEDGFEKLPIHWMGWPALGGVVVGGVGLLSPHTMGVGYDNIDRILSGELAGQAVIVFCALKFVSWTLSLGTGTSGGTLAPIFTIGGGLGAAHRRARRVGAPRRRRRSARRRARRDGGALRGRLEGAAGVGRLCLRDDPSADEPPPAPRRVHGRVPRVGDDDAKLHHDGENRPPRRPRRERLHGRLPRAGAHRRRRHEGGRHSEGEGHVRVHPSLDRDALRGLRPPGVPGGRR